MNKINENVKKTIVISIVCILFLSILMSITYAWISDKNLSKISVSTSMQRSYFESGDGTASKPFEIARPIQLYYFSWLQQLGFFNMEDEDNEGNIKQNFFYLSTDLDMTGYKIAPIGTAANPFVGGFDGQGHIISNLTVINDNTLTDIPQDGQTGDQIIGFFGVIGSYESSPSFAFSSSENYVKSFCLDNVTINSATPNDDITLVGIIAGYVNGTVADVAICNSNIIVTSGVSATTISSNLSDFTLVGYCEPEYKDTLGITEIKISKSNVESIITSTNEGMENEWGGSIAMQSMYERLVRIYVAAQTGYSYAPTKTYYYTESGDLIFSDSTNLNIPSVRRYSDPDIGKFSIYSSQTSVTSSGDAYTYSLGKTTTVYNIRQTSSNPDGTFITDGTNYLSLSGTSVTNITDLTTATLWNYNGTNGTISAVVNGTTRYLNQSGTTTALTIGTSSSTATVWTYTGDGKISCVNGATTYYLDYNYSQNWRLTTGNEIVGYKVSSGGNYISISGSSIVNVTNQANATVWSFSNGTSGYMSAVSAGTTYYLKMTRSGWLSYTYSLSLSTSQSTNLTNNSNKLTGDNCGLRFSSSNWNADATNNATTLTFTSVQGPIPIQSFSLVDVTREAFSEPDQYTTYFPLAVKNPNGTIVNINNYGVASNNTGYVISGSEYIHQGGGTYRDSDIRVSKYAMENIEVSLGQKSYVPEMLEILTQTSSSNGVVRITDDYNNSHTNNNTTIKAYSAYTVNNLGLQKYNEARNSLNDLLGGKNQVYGLHFMDSTISKDRLLTVEKAVIDNTTYKDYEMPMDSIDFTLSTNGYIDFYAGTYFPGNDSFFSLHQIFRYKDQLARESIICVYEASGKPTIYKFVNGEYYTYANGTYIEAKLENDFASTYTQKFEYVYMKASDPAAPLYYKDSSNYYTYSNGVFTQQTSLPAGYFDINIIIDIKEISLVYAVYTATGLPDVKKDFIYKFTDGTYSSPLTEGYVLAFDLSWITNPNIVLKAVYYFEIPANAGEYALGSVPGKNGAYLMYLDLSSNAQKVYRTAITDVTTTTSIVYEYPKGVQLVADLENYNGTVNDTDSVAMLLSPTFAGNFINISRVGNSATFTAGAGRSASFIGDGISFKDSGGNKASISPFSQNVVIVETVKHYDYNVVTEETQLTIRITTIAADGTRSLKIINPDGSELIGVDDGHEISVGDDAFAFHTVLPSIDTVITTETLYSFSLNAEGIIDVNEDVTCDIIIDSTDDLTITVDDFSTDYTLINGNDIDTEIMIITVNGNVVGEVGSKIIITASND